MSNVKKHDLGAVDDLYQHCANIAGAVEVTPADSNHNIDGYRSLSGLVRSANAMGRPFAGAASNLATLFYGRDQQGRFYGFAVYQRKNK